MYAPSLFSRSRTKSNPSASMCFARAAWTWSGLSFTDEAVMVGFIVGSFRCRRWPCSSLIKLDPALLFGGRETHERPGLPNPADRVQLLDQEPPEGRHVLDPHLEEERELAGDVVTFENLVERVHRLDEAPLKLRMLDEDLDERRDVAPQLPLVEDRHVAPDGASLLQLPDPLVHRGGRQPHHLRHPGLRNLGVLLQETENFAVDRVQDRPVATFCKAIDLHPLIIFVKSAFGVNIYFDSGRRHPP